MSFAEVSGYLSLVIFSKQVSKLSKGSMKKLITPLPFGEGLGERPSFLGIPLHRTNYLE